MLIILEGPDGAGKSTLAQQLLTYLSVKYPRDHVELIHRGPPQEHPLDEYAVPLLGYRPGAGTHLIIDRWHWGEMIYPAILGRKTKMTREIFAYIEMLVTQRGGVVVMPRVSIEQLFERYDKRGDDLIARHQLFTIASAFDSVYDVAITGVTMRSPTPDPVVDIARNRERVAYSRAMLTTPVTTSWYPQILLMGDTRGCSGKACDCRDRHYANGTAFMPYSGTSGAYLLKSLTSAGAARDVALANACDVDLPILVWDKYNRPAIVALGVRAHKSLEINGIEHGVVPHPQFVRRFHHKAFTEYGRLIWDVSQSGRNELSWRPTSTPSRVSASTATH